MAAPLILLLIGCAGQRAERANKDGNALLKAGKTEAAVAAFASAVQAKPDVGKYHYNLGVAYARLSHYDEASRQFAEAVRLDPADIEASRLLTMTNNAIAARTRVNY